MPFRAAGDGGAVQGVGKIIGKEVNAGGLVGCPPISAKCTSIRTTFCTMSGKRIVGLSTYPNLPALTAGWVNNFRYRFLVGN